MTSGGARGDTEAILHAAIDAVRPERLVPWRLARRGDHLLRDGRPFDPPVSLGGRIVVVGGGKAAAGMAAAVERLLSAATADPGRLTGLVSVPAGCGLRLDRIETRETRPGGVNLPTPAAVAATAEMRSLLAGLGEGDLAIVLVSGGGSALIEEPRKGVSLEEIIARTRQLSDAGAGIREINALRLTLSRVKGGGLARACTAGRLVAVVLSDVIGDPLDLIASGPCMPRSGAEGGEWTTPSGCRVSHVLLGTNATAVAAAAAAARGLGYDTTAREARDMPETADEVGRRLADEANALASLASRDGRPRAVIEGGEATVVVPADHGLGGRNQQTVLAAVAEWNPSARRWPAGLVIASIGTDGEDGPTEAAGGLADAEVVGRLAATDIAAAITRCDAHSALAAAGGLVRTGPTGTNVADVRTILARP